MKSETFEMRMTTSSATDIQSPLPSCGGSRIEGALHTKTTLACVFLPELSMQMRCFPVSWNLGFLFYSLTFSGFVYVNLAVQNRETATCKGLFYWVFLTFKRPCMHSARRVTVVTTQIFGVAPAGQGSSDLYDVPAYSMNAD